MDMKKLSTQFKEFTEELAGGLAPEDVAVLGRLEAGGRDLSHMFGYCVGRLQSLGVSIEDITHGARVIGALAKEGA